MRAEHRDWRDFPRCVHGERRDRRTKKGEPVCPFCRRAERDRAPGWTAPPLDIPSLQAHDDTLFDPIEGEPS